MVIFVKSIGIVVTGLGIAFLLNQKALKQCMYFCEQGKRLYYVGILRVIFGIILLVGSGLCRLTGVVAAIGVLVLVSGILIFVMGIGKVKTMLKWWQGRPPFILRLMALIATLIGLLLLYSV